MRSSIGDWRCRSPKPGEWPTWHRLGVKQRVSTPPSLTHTDASADSDAAANAYYDSQADASPNAALHTTTDSGALPHGNAQASHSPASGPD